MSAVCEVEQDRPRRTVALKVHKPGFASPETLRRFEGETLVLGRSRHPGIAQIYAAGSAETDLGPQPYFTMEFIHGELMGLLAEQGALIKRWRGVDPAHDGRSFRTASL